MGQLEKYYAGDESWEKYVKLYEEDYLDDNAHTLAKSIGGHLDLAVVIYGKRGLKEGLWWLEQNVPALNNITPIDCLASPKLIRRLRETLMRMP